MARTVDHSKTRYSLSIFQNFPPTIVYSDRVLGGMSVKQIISQSPIISLYEESAAYISQFAVVMDRSYEETRR